VIHSAKVLVAAFERIIKAAARAVNKGPERRPQMDADEHRSGRRKNEEEITFKLLKGFDP
jgi:hypothetical protein